MYMAVSQNIKPRSIPWTHRTIHTPDPYQNAGDPDRSIRLDHRGPIHTRILTQPHMFVLYTISMYIYNYIYIYICTIYKDHRYRCIGVHRCCNDQPELAKMFLGLIAQPPTSLDLSHLTSLEVITIVVTYQGHVCQHQDMWYVNTMCPHSYSSASTIIPHTVGSVPKDQCSYNWVKHWTNDYISKCRLYSIQK